ncbi:unnamed protein product [Ambrosiozyma monospora]|uniref:Unnamed protein product n=1 Tax=Ambrosiozyma monospora TaxID=43982 RepID=A0A9W7DN05_AMBMO|nr:unnamed protein product [Ambrosiozyma monospora]
MLKRTIALSLGHTIAFAFGATTITVDASTTSSLTHSSSTSVVSSSSSSSTVSSTSTASPSSISSSSSSLSSSAESASSSVPVTSIASSSSESNSALIFPGDGGELSFYSENKDGKAYWTLKLPASYGYAKGLNYYSNTDHIFNFISDNFVFTIGGTTVPTSDYTVTFGTQFDLDYSGVIDGQDVVIKVLSEGETDATYPVA